MAPEAHVLVVDDQPDLREMVLLALEENGYAVTLANDGSSMRHALAVRAIDLAIVDAVLPDAAGSDLIEVARRHRAKVILMSGHPEQIERFADGSVPFLAKPFRIDELLACVRRALAAADGEDAASPPPQTDRT
jgi:two-component system, OmpR family, response regulator